MNKVEISGVNTAKLPLLTPEEKTALMTKIKQGDEQARQEFINGNLRLVLSIIRRFQVGCIGLIKAIDNFDLSQNVQFSTYAVPMIIGEIRRYLRDNNVIRVSRSIRDLAYKALGIKERIYNEQQREATVMEIAEELGVTKEDVIISLNAIQEPVSLQEPAYSESTENIYLMDQIGDKKNTDELWTQNLTIEEAMKRLNDKEKMIINKRFFEGRTQVEVAEEIGISQAQVSRLERLAIGHIRRIYK